MKATEESKTKPTPRQMQILRLLAEGKKQDGIAYQLRISRLTVRNHIYGMYERIHANCGANAVAIGFRQGWLQ